MTGWLLPWLAVYPVRHTIVGPHREARPLPLRIVFLAQAPKDWWSMHSLYEACLADHRFEVNVISIDWGTWVGIAEDCDALFGSLGVAAIDGRGSPTLLEQLDPDVLVTTSPYDQFRESAYQTENLVRSTKVAYIPYGADFGDASGRLAAFWYGQPIVRRAWRIFTSSPRRTAQWVEHAGVAPDQVVGLGLPVIDQTYAPAGRQAVPAVVEEASAGRYRVLYTPHHSLDAWSTFLQHRSTLRRLLTEHDDLYVMFRPHPGLGPKLEESGIMGRDAFVGALGDSRVHLDRSDEFIASLKWADVLVSDASSMLFHFAPTGKPIIYLHREGGAGLDPLAQEWVSRTCYVVRADEGLESTLLRLRDGIDPLAPARREQVRSGDTFDFAYGAGRRIRDYLAIAL